MTRRESLTQKLLKRQEWAEKAAKRSEQKYTAAHAISDMIPLGQPILVGHHSEKPMRRAIARIQSNFEKGYEEQKLAEHHRGAASGLARALEHNIFSDDSDAIAALEQRIAEYEVKAARMVETNKAWRKAKGDVPTFAKLAGLTEPQAQAVAKRIETAYSWEKQPYASYELSSARTHISNDKKRIEQIKKQQARSEQAEAAGGVVVEGTGDWVRVTFAEKPPYTIIAALKAAGFSWGVGSWHGPREKLPDGIA